MSNMLYLSPSGGTGGSSISTMLECGRKYYYRHIERLKPKSIKTCLFFGTTIHTAILVRHLQQHQSKEDVISFIHNDISSKYINSTFGPYAYELDEDAETLITKAIKMYEVFAENTFYPIGIEEKYQVYLENPQTGEVDKSTVIQGTLDLVERTSLKMEYVDNKLTISKQNIEGNDVIISDLKTSASKMSSLSTYLLQLGIYSYLYYIKFRKLPTATSIINITKCKVPTYQQLFYKPNHEMVTHTYNLIFDCVNRIREKKFDPNYSACGGKFFNQCEYHHLCHNTTEIPEYEIDKFLIKENV